MEQKQVNMNIQEGKNFFSDEISLNFNPMVFIFDFKSTTPRIDPRMQDGTMNLCMEHNVVSLMPYNALLLRDILNAAIANYEKQFGAIKEPEALKIHNDNLKKMTKIKGKTISPSYFG
jgi:hypothetical protein